MHVLVHAEILRAPAEVDPRVEHVPRIETDALGDALVLRDHHADLGRRVELRYRLGERADNVGKAARLYEGQALGSRKQYLHTLVPFLRITG